MKITLYFMKYLKLFKELNQLITESQVFNFDEYKKQITFIISKLKKGEDITWLDRQHIYTLITNSVSKIGDSKNIGFTLEDCKKWKDYFLSSYWNSNGVWSQKDFNQQLARKLGPDKTLNYYVTISKERTNIINFGKSLMDLSKRLSELSTQTKSPISYKTHTILDVFVTHNDSLKVYYYDVDLKDSIEKIVNDWIKSNGLKVSDRTHYHGADVRKGSGDKESWGQILASTVLEELEKVIKQKGNKFSDEQYYEWFKGWMPNLIKNIKIQHK
jgi:hypothetical protein